jgi:hypothetical protein
MGKRCLVAQPLSERLCGEITVVRYEGFGRMNLNCRPVAAEWGWPLAQRGEPRRGGRHCSLFEATMWCCLHRKAAGGGWQYDSQMSSCSGRGEMGLWTVGVAQDGWYGDLIISDQG